jgi:hypothetical protein
MKLHGELASITNRFFPSKNTRACFALAIAVVGLQMPRSAPQKAKVPEGPTAPLPESFPRSDIQLQPGETSSLLNIRLCHSELALGSYRYRISSAPDATSEARSNWVIIAVARQMSLLGAVGVYSEDRQECEAEVEGPKSHDTGSWTSEPRGRSLPNYVNRLAISAED